MPSHAPHSDEREGGCPDQRIPLERRDRVVHTVCGSQSVSSSSVAHHYNPSPRALLVLSIIGTLGLVLLLIPRYYDVDADAIIVGIGCPYESAACCLFLLLLSFIFPS